MIAHISGKIRSKKQLSIVIDVSGISYEVMIPPAVMKGDRQSKDSGRGNNAHNLPLLPDGPVQSDTGACRIFK